MKRISQFQSLFVFLLLITTSIFISCSKNEDAKLPEIVFKTGSNYTSSDASVSSSEIIKVGTISTKNESDLKSFRIYSSVGSGAFSIRKTFYMSSGELERYENDYQFTLTSNSGYETWKFEITDAAGNSNSVSLKLTIK